MRLLGIRCNQKISVDATPFGRSEHMTALYMPSILSMSTPVVILCLAPGASAKSGGRYQEQKLPGSGLD